MQNHNSDQPADYNDRPNYGNYPPQQHPQGGYAPPHMQNGANGGGFQAYRPADMHHQQQQAPPPTHMPQSADITLLQALQAAVQLHQRSKQFQIPPAQAQAMQQHQHQMAVQRQPSLPNTAGTRDDISPKSSDQGEEPNGNIPGFSENFVGVKLPVICNEVRGMAYLDQQVVACYCESCSSRVAAGHDRPLYSFTRFERHTGSKAKKWRLSLRIEPGVVKECPPGDQPMPLGQWLEMKGMLHWAPRTTIKIGVGGEDSGAAPAAAAAQQHRQVLAQAVALSRAMPPQKREREPQAAPPPLPPPAFRETAAATAAYPTPDLPNLSDKATWLKNQKERFAAITAAETPAKHSAIFQLVYGLLDAGNERRAFNEQYMPWLNETGWQRVESEFATLLSYLQMLESMETLAVVAQMKAYLKSVIVRLSLGNTTTSNGGSGEVAAVKAAADS